MVSEWPANALANSWVDETTTLRYLAAPFVEDIRGELRSPIVADNLEGLKRTGRRAARVLDLGCVNGVYRLYLQEFPPTRAWEYTGADINPAVIAECRKWFPGAAFDLVMAEGRLPYDDGQFDVVLASGMLQYARDWQARLADLRRVSREYILLGRLPLWQRQDSCIAIQIVKYPDGEEQHPLHLLNRKALEMVLQEQGLTVVFCKPGFERVRLLEVAEEAVYHTYLLRRDDVSREEPAANPA